MKKIKGQNVIEYILLCVAVLIVCIFFFAKQGPMGNVLNSALGSVVTEINNVNSQIQFNGN